MTMTTSDEQADVELERQFLHALTAITRSAALEVCRVDSCIASTRILTSVLDYFGYPSEPLPCRAVVWTSLGFEQAEANVPFEQWPEGAWSVGVSGTGKTTGKRWDGHLVAMVADRWLIDPSADQFTRPQRGMNVGLVVVDAAEWGDRSRLHCWRRPDGLVVGYSLMPNPGGWRDSPDWRQGRYRDVVGTVIRRLKDVGVVPLGSDPQ